MVKACFLKEKHKELDVVGSICFRFSEPRFLVNQDFEISQLSEESAV